MEKQIMTVTELNQWMKELIESPEYFKNIYVTGEISNLTFNRSGHIYFSIKDETAAIRCMIWKDNVKVLNRWNPKDGMKITCNGRLTYYVAGGSIAFEVRDVTLEGKGELQQLYDQRFTWLKKHGWTGESIKKPIPKFPKTIGIVTAETGAVVHDLISSITRRYPQVNVYLFPTQVQGNQAREDIAQKIQQANQFQPQLDVLIVGRGGGSYEDLWAFNEMEVLKAVYDSQIPIISAVGHEPDITLIDYVSDKRAATPTAAGEIVTPNLDELKLNLNQLQQEWRKSIDNYLDLKLEWIKRVHLANSNYLNQLLNNKNSTIQLLYKSWIDKTHLFSQLKENELEKLTIHWKFLSPLQPLDKGFALIYDQNQMIVKDVKKLFIGQKIDLHTQQGTVEAQVRRVLLKGRKK